MDKNTINTKKRELVMTFKALRGMAPEYLTQMFHVSDNQT
jgi:hypothetical protein